MPDLLPVTAPASQDCQVVELRQYTTHPNQRDVLIELFDRELVESQEAVGMRVMGQFRDLDDADRFVWLRGFADMASRAQGLQAFYSGPVWAAHSNAANPTMLDWDNVLLLKPAWPGAAVASKPDDRAAAGSAELPPGILGATVFSLREAAGETLLLLCRDAMTHTLRAGGAKVLGWYVTEPSANNFARLPVREGEQVLVGLAMFSDTAALDAFAHGEAWQRDVAPLLEPWLVGRPQALRLAPTARSAIHA
ncbi:NIPSNAP family protein [uncultured Ralstonia sp.]|jgi:hypothetical protein|uniref:NIPSNAP family protein n=1 Tax=Ralstonia sp. TaxID=54061 RepID=UPI001EACB0EA|nr:NIPSNAP family protein [uncultured Ralstonia sp.]UCF24457.1 MAG: NIPSNAP family protein [Ralstonia sp.]